VRVTRVTDTFSGPLVGFERLVHGFDGIAVRSVDFVRLTHRNDQLGRSVVGYARLTHSGRAARNGDGPQANGQERRRALVPDLAVAPGDEPA
jgi:hypothetical protein